MFALKNASILGLVIFQVEKGVFVEILKNIRVWLIPAGFTMMTYTRRVRVLNNVFVRHV